MSRAFCASVRGYLGRVARLDARYSPKADREGRQHPLEVVFGRIADHLLSRQGILRIDAVSRELVLEAFHGAMIDAAATRERKAAGDYASDPKAARFPALEDAFGGKVAKAVGPVQNRKWASRACLKIGGRKRRKPDGKRLRQLRPHLPDVRRLSWPR